jgi:cell envelope opacity-associated protein A
MPRLQKLRIKAGWIAVINHQLVKEGLNKHSMHEEDIIDVITDILHFALNHRQLGPNVEVERVLRCVQNHLHAELPKSTELPTRAGCTKQKTGKCAKKCKAKKGKTLMEVFVKEPR